MAQSDEMRNGIVHPYPIQPINHSCSSTASVWALAHLTASPIWMSLFDEPHVRITHFLSARARIDPQNAVGTTCNLTSSRGRTIRQWGSPKPVGAQHFAIHLSEWIAMGGVR